MNRRIKSHVVAFRVTNDEFKMIKKMKKGLGITQSKFLHQMFLNRTRRIKFVLPPIIDSKSADELRDGVGRLSTQASELISQWKHAGDNINQLARAMNTSLKKNGSADFIQIKKTADLVAKLHDTSSKLLVNEYKLMKGVTKLWHIAELPTQH